MEKTALQTSNKEALTDTQKPNKTEKRYRLGRPTKYKVGYCQQIIDYFTQPLYTECVKSRVTTKSGNVTEHMERIGLPPKWFGAFAYSIGTTQKTLLDWVAKYPAFSKAYTRAKELQAEHIRGLANMGIYNSNFAQFTMVNISDWRIKNNVELSGKVEQQVFFDNMLDKSAEALKNEKAVLTKNRLN
jgi:hypothetical protein